MGRDALNGATFRTYSVGPGVKVHAWFANGRRSSPWAVFLHGGSWEHGRGDLSGGATWARHETPRGFQVFALDYRLSPVATWPAQREDVAEAVDWIRAHATRFGLDLGRGAILGESAGGQLAAIEASRGGFAAAVDLAGAVDPPALLDAPDADLAAATMRLVGCPVLTCPQLWQDTRAIAHVSALTPPFLIIHSSDDPVVPSSMSRSFAAELRAAGKRVTLRVVAGSAHGLLDHPAVLSQIDSFLGSATH